MNRPNVGRVLCALTLAFYTWGVAGCGGRSSSWLDSEPREPATGVAGDDGRAEGGTTATHGSAGLGAGASDGNAGAGGAGASGGNAGAGGDVASGGTFGTAGGGTTGGIAGATGEDSCDADFSLGEPVTLEAPDNARNAFIIDVDGDARNDVLVLSSELLFVYRQGEDGNLLPAERYATALPGLPRGDAADVGDFDADGAPDLVVAGSDSVIWIQNDGAGAFLPPVRLSVDSPMSSDAVSERLRLADIDADGALDATLLVPNLVDLATYYGDGRGGVRAVRFARSNAFSLVDFALIDVTGDDRPDAIALTGFGDLLAFDQVAGELVADGRVLSPQVIDGLGSNVATGDIDADGEDDIVVSGSGNQPVDLRLLRHADQFAAVAPLETYDVPEATLIADLNGDSLADVAVLHGGWMKVGIYQQCRGALLPERLFDIPYATHYDHRALAAGDLDGDGCSDLAIADYASGLTLLYGRGCAHR